MNSNTLIAIGTSYYLYLVLNLSSTDPVWTKKSPRSSYGITLENYLTAVAYESNREYCLKIFDPNGNNTGSAISISQNTTNTSVLCNPFILIPTIQGFSYIGPNASNCQKYIYREFDIYGLPTGISKNITLASPILSSLVGFSYENGTFLLYYCFSSNCTIQAFQSGNSISNFSWFSDSVFISSVCFLKNGTLLRQNLKNETSGILYNISTFSFDMGLSYNIYPPFPSAGIGNTTSLQITESNTALIVAGVTDGNLLFIQKHDLNGEIISNLAIIEGGASQFSYLISIATLNNDGLICLFNNGKYLHIELDNKEYGLKAASLFTIGQVIASPNHRDFSFIPSVPNSFNINIEFLNKEVEIPKISFDLTLPGYLEKTHSDRFFINIIAVVVSTTFGLVTLVYISRKQNQNPKNGQKQTQNYMKKKLEQMQKILEIHENKINQMYKNQPHLHLAQH